jgi:hypothetical protein
VPIGLINGSVYCGGTRPPLEPFRVISALRRLLANPGMTDSDIVEAVGAPDFPTGCAVTGDLDALVSGRRTVLGLTGRIEIAGDRQLVITTLPPEASAFDVVRAVSSRQAPRPWAQTHPRLSEETTLPIAAVDQASMDGLAFVSITVTLDPGADAEAVRSALLEIDGITQQVPAAFPAPLAALLRSCLDHGDAESFAVSLDRLEDAIQADRKQEIRHR